MNTSKPSRTFIIFILGAFDTIAPLTIDMYLPAFSQMAADFGTTTARVSLSLTSYFIGLGLGQVVYGPLLDRYGRHKPLYYGMALYVIACVGCAWATSVELFITFRLIQALGCCVSAVGVRAMVRDYFSVEESPKIFSMLMLILSVSPLLAPSLGSVITHQLHWSWVFYILAFIVIIILIITYLFLPEVYKPDPTVSLRIKPMVRTYCEILRNRQFLTYTLASSFAIGGLFVYLAGSTVILLDQFKVTPTFYAILFALQSIGLIVGNNLNIRLLRKVKADKLFKMALTIQMGSALLFLIGAGLNWYGVYATVGFFFVLLTCLGMTFPNSSALALAPFTNNIGSASSLLGCVQIGIGGLISASIGLFNTQTSLLVALMIALSAVAAWITLLIGKPEKHSS
ncbi:MAG: multidrug effflux MFS transporter [Cyclobacteriaceae bacterium]|nr:multidrug effflux MFS transporter [Cyclobacteriaceae bacterium]